MHTAREVREHLGHPVVDADGHLVESLPILADRVRKMAGDDIADRFLGGSPTYRSRQAPILRPMEEAGTTTRQAAAPWWALPTDPLDRATAFVPALLYERLDDLGIDFAILYPSVGLTVIGHPDDEVRRFVCRAINEYACGAHRRPGGPLDGRGDGALPRPGRGDRRAGPCRRRVRPQGGHAQQLRAPASRDRSRSRVVRPVGDRQRLRLRPCLEPVRGARRRRHRAHAHHGPTPAGLPVPLHAQPHRQFRDRKRRLCQGARVWRRDAPVPRSAGRLLGRWGTRSACSCSET